MSIEITSYETLIAAARQQPDPQKLLFVFLKAGLPEGHTPDEAARFEDGQGGALAPVFCVALAPDDLTTFADLAAEADSMGPPWQIVLVAALGGVDGQPPTDEKVDEWLGLMQRTVQAGGNLGQFLAFNHDGEPVFFG